MVVDRNKVKRLSLVNHTTKTIHHHHHHHHHTFKFINIASSAGINKAITHDNYCSPHVRFLQLLLSLALVDRIRSPAAFKMEIFVTKIKSWKLLLLLQRVSSCMWQVF